MKTRRADFAGSWYPGGESDCKKAIEKFTRIDIACASPDETPVGGIVPHAGWYFSGEIACNVIRCLKDGADPDSIIIFGRHLHPGSESYIMKEGRWATPFGDVEIDDEVAAALTDEFAFSVETTADYEQDNTIELQLPFIKHFFPSTKIVPMGLPPRLESLKIARRAAKISTEMGRSTIVVGSTDLTHYGYNYGFTPRGVGEDALEWVKNSNDKRIVDIILDMDEERVIEESLENHNACCGGAAGAAIAASKELGSVKAKKTMYSTSYDIRPDTSFVGYVGIVFYKKRQANGS